MGVAVPERVRGLETDKSSTSSGEPDFRLRGVTVPEEVARDKCLFSRKARTSLSKIDW